MNGSNNPVAGSSTQNNITPIKNPFETNAQKLIDMERSKSGIYPGQPKASQGANTIVDEKPPKVYWQSSESEGEDDPFRRLINIGEFRNLIYLEAVGACVILISQVLLYWINHYNNYRNLTLLGLTGIGIWAPIAFSIPTFLLSYLTLITHSSYAVTNALTCQLMSFAMGIALMTMGNIHMSKLGRYVLDKYDPEVSETVFTFFFIIGAAYVTVTSLLASIQYIRVMYCRRRGRPSINGP